MGLASRRCVAGSVSFGGCRHEGHGDAVSAKESMLRAVRSKYAQTSGDFMAAVAWVHCKRRNWT